MFRFSSGVFAMLLVLSACATVAAGPRLSPAHVSRIADVEVRHNMRIDLRQYEISEPHYVSREGYWSVIYYLKANKRAAFTIRVSDKEQKAAFKESDDGIFEGPLNTKPDLH